MFGKCNSLSLLIPVDIKFSLKSDFLAIKTYLIINLLKS